MRRRHSCLAFLTVLTFACAPTHRHGAGPAPSGAAAASAASDAATARHSFADVEHWSKVFDDPARDTWQRPREVVDALELEPGATVADLGAGTGYFVPYLSAAVGDAGTVLAVEPEPALLAHLRTRAERGGWRNVTPILASLDNPRIPPRSADVVLIVDTYHHIDGRVAYLERLRTALKPGGRVAIVDWEKGELPVGPPPSHKLAREQVVAEMQRGGYDLTGAPDILPYQYMLIFAPRPVDVPGVGQRGRSRATRSIFERLAWVF